MILSPQEVEPAPSTALMVFWNLFLVAFLAATGVYAGVIERDTKELSVRNTPSATGINNGFYFYFWSDGNGNVTYTNGPGGTYSVVWSGDVDFIAGKGWNPGSAHAISYTAAFTPSSNSFLFVYGWTTNPLVEYYIVEGFGTYNPSTGGTHKGTVISDGGLYDIYTITRTNVPTIQGTATYNQYWSVRSSKRTSGTVTTANHFNAWAALGMHLGTFNYQIFAIEGYGVGSGSATVTVGTGTVSTNPTSSSSTASSSTTGTTSCSAKYGQCGGTGWTGPTCCVGSTCTYDNAVYSQCL